MAHFVRFIKARWLKNKWKAYLIEKEIAYYENEFDEFSEESEFEEEYTVWRYTNKSKAPNSGENFVMKSLLGFTGGVLLTYLFFLFFYIGVNFSLKTTTSICGLVGIILSLGFAFSSIVRCYVLLFLPVFFSKEGRQVLLTYALFLAFTGPASNTMHNMGILSDSMTCGQEMVKRTMRQIFEMVKAPFRALKETMEKITKALKKVIQSIEHFVKEMERLIDSIYHGIRNAKEWLRSIVMLCHNKLGTPFQRCMKTFDDAIADCKAKLGVIDFLCHLVHLIKTLCYSVKGFDFMCLYTELACDKTLTEMKKRMKEFNLRVKNLFYVSVEFYESYKPETKAANRTEKETKTTIEMIAKHVEKLQTVFSFFGFTFCLLFLFLFIKVYSYKYKFLCSDQYDNVYINKYIVDLDIKRAQMNRETVLPLEPRERKKYGKPTAIRLLEIEKSRISQSMSVLSLTSFKILTFLAVDYCLFWVLLTIYRSGYDAIMEAEKSELGIHVGGKGILPNFYRDLEKTFEVPENPNMRLTPTHCLPDPIQPDTERYIQIGFLVLLCWILTMTEAYGLRLRNVVMCHYYPDRARERAVWLYNHILQSRGSFLRYARRQLRRKYCGQLQGTEGLSQRLFANFPLLNILCGGNKENNCLICGPPESSSPQLKKCRTPDCQGCYCLECFATLQNVCTICQHPIEYGDFSDISEEIDSSEEEMYGRKVKEIPECDAPVQEVFLTFKDMEMRDRFRDVELNKVPDYAKLGDLYNDKEVLKKRLKVVLQRQIKNAKNGKQQARKKKQSMYKQIKLKVQNLISNQKRKKSRGIILRKRALKKKFAEKVDSLKNLKRKKESEAEYLLEESGKRSKSKVSFKLEPEIIELHELDYKRLKEKVREKIEWLKENKRLSGNREV